MRKYQSGGSRAPITVRAPRPRAWRAKLLPPPAAAAARPAAALSCTTKRLAAGVSSGASMQQPRSRMLTARRRLQEEKRRLVRGNSVFFDQIDSEDFQHRSVHLSSSPPLSACPLSASPLSASPLSASPLSSSLSLLSISSLMLLSPLLSSLLCPLSSPRSPLRRLKHTHHQRKEGVRGNMTLDRRQWPGTWRPARWCRAPTAAGGPSTSGGASTTRFVSSTLPPFLDRSPALPSTVPLP